MKNASDIQWCKNLYACLNDGGVWCVPRTGLVFRKESGALVLQEAIPGVASASAQEDDFICIRDHFADAGISVRR